MSLQGKKGYSFSFERLTVKKSTHIIVYHKWLSFTNDIVHNY